MRRIAALADLPGIDVIPHAWTTAITAAAGRQFQAACPAVPLFEYVSPRVFDSLLRRELTSPEPRLEDGTMALPDGPGLGIELNEELVARLRVG
jgi:L-alanine-DL-glutamate epimerase-like enolase superfamily enzyme